MNTEEKLEALARLVERYDDMLYTAGQRDNIHRIGDIRSAYSDMVNNARDILKGEG